MTKKHVQDAEKYQSFFHHTGNTMTVSLSASYSGAVREALISTQQFTKMMTSSPFVSLVARENGNVSIP